MIELSEKWASVLLANPETGMGYTVCDVELVSGRVFHRVVIVGGIITRCDGSGVVPFQANEIARIVPTHDKTAL